jgi:pimeloyl-[acyl-carrier protein] methyl ester esterase
MKNPLSEKFHDSIQQDTPEGQCVTEQSGAEQCNSVQCVFVHGWAMNSAVWAPLLERLPDSIEPICVDLPGHGEFNQQGFTDLEDLTEHLQSQLQSKLKAPAIWIGWSLGALPVLKLAKQRPDLVKKAFIIASNPCFVKREGWSTAVADEVFDLFAGNLQQNLDKTIQRFLSLQVQGMEESREVLRQLRAAINAQGMASPEALTAGLDVLKSTDLRELLQHLSVPLCWLLGDKDSLVPVQLNDYLNKLSHVKSHIISGSAHLPFVSHVDDVLQQLTDFIDD